MRDKHKFTAEEDAFIEEHYHHGAIHGKKMPEGYMSTTQIAKRLGLSKGSITTRAHTLKGTKRNGVMVVQARREVPKSLPKLKFMGEV